MRQYKSALLIGRFQPFHFGHLYLIKKTLEIADKVIIGIGSASIFDENNPLDYQTRKEIIQAVFYKEKIEDRLLKIAPLEDFFDDKKWLNNVKKMIGKFDVVVSNNDWTNDIMEKAGYEVKRFPYYKRSLYEGWRIRKLAKQGKRWQERIPNYLFSNLKFLSSKQIFKHVIIGGTFDRFHKGHKEFIKTAFKYGKKITVGIAKKEVYKNKPYFETIESINIRKKSVSDFLKKNRWINRTKIISFSEFTGGADKMKNVDAIVVSRQTYFNALRINDLREKNGLNQLRIIIVKDILAEDGRMISSERIRAGQINRNGKVYDLRFKIGKEELILPDKMKEELRKPLGKVYKSAKEILELIDKSNIKPVLIIAVGDIIVNSLIKEGINPDVKIIDFRSRKVPIKTNFHTLRVQRYENKPGTINLKTAERLKQLISSHPKGVQTRSWFIVDGEEDLLALPAILYAPLGSLVLYGHWQYGVIGIEITEKIKNKVKILLNYFKI